MFLNQRTIERSKRQLEKMHSDIADRCDFYTLFADPTRLKMLLLFRSHKELCPTDLSHVLGVSMSAVSHQLRLLERVGVVVKNKEGKAMCYQLSGEGRDFITQLKGLGRTL